MAAVVQFARDFDDFMRRLRRLTIAHQRILEAIAFWPKLAPHTANVLYETFFDEYRQVLASNLTRESLSQLLPDDLRALGLIVERILLPETSALVRAELVRQLLYVGAIEEAAELLEPGESGKLALSIERGEEPHDEIELLGTLCGSLRERAPELQRQLKGYHEEWEGSRSELWSGQVRALFVEYRDGEGSGRGSMFTLTGHAHLDKTLPDNQVVFEHQVRAADDPLLAGAFSALAAVRATVRSFGNHSREFIRLECGVEGARSAVSGESIGLAVALLAYVQLMKDRVERHERFMASDVAVTGVIDDAGRLLPVNETTLGKKIERAFFSPVKYVVIPRSSYESAHRALESLQVQYPRRRLKLIAHDTLADVIEDRNVVRAEKVCPIPYVTRKAAHYARSSTVRVTLISLLIVCAIVAMGIGLAGSNSIPNSGRVSKNDITVLNAAGDVLFTKSMRSILGFQMDTVGSSLLVQRLSDTGRTELFLLASPDYEGSERDKCKIIHMDDTGGVLGQLVLDDKLEDYGRGMRFRSQAIGVNKFVWDPNLSPARTVLLVCRTERTFDLSQLIAIDASSLRVISRGWHHALITHLCAYDLDLVDGLELIFASVGHGDSGGDICVTRLTDLGDTVLAIRLPKSGVSRITQPAMQQIFEIQTSASGIDIHSMEFIKDPGILYRFDRRMRLISAIPTSYFIAQRQAYYEEHSNLDSASFFSVPVVGELKVVNPSEKAR